MSASFTIDMHCHSSMKPYGKSFDKDFINNPLPSENNSIYYYNPPTPKEKILNIATTITRFSQSGFTALHKGNIKVIGASLYPAERGFFNGKLGTGKITDTISDFITGFGKTRIDFIQSNHDYFTDLKREYEFYRQLHGTMVKVEGKDIEYRITRNMHELSQNINNTVTDTLSVILTIEGFHAFNSYANRRAEVNEILNNVYDLKSWEYRPLFISAGHHFYNGMCGQAYSLSGITGYILDQSFGADTGISSLGFDVIGALLNNTNHNRIHIDVKHMSVESRKQYYKYLEDKPDIPVIVSHGAINGLESFENRINTFSNGKNVFNQADINFFDNEIIKIADSKGIFCIQLDERRLANKEQLKQSFFNLSKKRMLTNRSELLWNQVRHIGEILDKNGRNAWTIAAIGSDFDGIVDPVNGFWTAEEFPLLKEYLRVHAKNYMAADGKNLQLNINKNIAPEEIIENLFVNNAMHFLGLYLR
ncbi:MAG: membrane dipeptidase [Bacteroidales bacterium]